MTHIHKLTLLGDDLIEKSVEVTPVYQQKINSYLSRIDLTNTGVVNFGIVGQNKLSSFSETVLKQMRSSNTNDIDNTLNKLTLELKVFDKAINGWSLKRLFEGTNKRIKRINAEYSRIEDTMQGIERVLEKQYRTLLVDLKLLEKLFDQNKQTYEDLSLYIYAGEIKLDEINEKILPELKRNKAENRIDMGGRIQKLEELVMYLERRIHNLRLSRVISLQLASQIKLIQSNNTGLVDKLYSCMANTIPLWRNQMILSLNVGNSQQAIETQNLISKFINKFLKRNNKTLMRSNRQLAQENVNTIVNLSTLQKINADLLQTVSSVINTQQEARRLKGSTENTLLNAERELVQLSGKI